MDQSAFRLLDQLQVSSNQLRVKLSESVTTRPSQPLSSHGLQGNTAILRVTLCGDGTPRIAVRRIVEISTTPGDSATCVPMCSGMARASLTFVCHRLRLCYGFSSFMIRVRCSARRPRRFPDTLANACCIRDTSVFVERNVESHNRGERRAAQRDEQHVWHCALVWRQLA